MPATLVRPITGFFILVKGETGLHCWMSTSGVARRLTPLRTTVLVIGCAVDGFHRNCSRRVVDVVARRVVDVPRRVIDVSRRVIDVSTCAIDSVHRNWSMRTANSRCHGM